MIMGKHLIVNISVFAYKLPQFLASIDYLKFLVAYNLFRPCSIAKDQLTHII